MHSSSRRAHDLVDRLANLSGSDSVRRVLDTPDGFGRAVPTGSGDLAPGSKRTPPGHMSPGPMTN